MPAIARYAATTLPPLVLLILAGTAWSELAWVALAWLTLVAATAHRLLDPPLCARANAGDPWAKALPITLAFGHFAVVLTTTGAIAAGVPTLGQGIALFLATAVFIGQVSHPNAHDLIHRTSAALRALGAAVYTSVGFGHHVSAHRLVHHAHVGTDDDPHTPQPGESVHSYLPRAWREGFEAGIVAEVDRLDRQGRGPNHITNPYWRWLGGAALALVVVSYLGGAIGALTLIGLGLLTGAQVLMSDYLHHYGLQRLVLPNGRLEPLAAHHRWNAPRRFRSNLSMNAPVHTSPHLDRQTETPTLPFSLPAMAVIALIPPLWRRMMDPRAVKVLEAAEQAHRHAEKPAPVLVAQRTTSVAPALPRPVPLPEASRPAPANTTDPIPEKTSVAALVDDAETDALLSRIQAATR